MGKLKAEAELFEGRHFDREVIILCVRWYLRFKLSLRDLVEMMAERGLSMAHTTIMRWVQRYAPEFEKRWRRFARTLVAGAANETARNQNAAERNRPLRDLHPQIVRGGARTGIQFAAGAARSLRGLHRQPAARRLGVPARGL